MQRFLYLYFLLFLNSRFGTEGIIYELSGSGAELFQVNNQTGEITVEPCATPGYPPCLDYETRKDYFLQYKVSSVNDRNRQYTYYVLNIVGKPNK